MGENDRVGLKGDKYTIPVIVKSGFEDASADHTAFIESVTDVAFPEGRPVYVREHMRTYLAGSECRTCFIDPLDHKPFALSLDRAGERSNSLQLKEECIDWDAWVRRTLIYSNPPHIMLRNERLILHSSYVLTPKGGIIFCGASGTGKSTQGELWRKHRDAVVESGEWRRKQFVSPVGTP